jgi:hypothetical protein
MILIYFFLLIYFCNYWKNIIKVKEISDHYPVEFDIL